MKKLSDLSTVREVDAFIDNEICRHCPELRIRAETGDYTAKERETNSKLNAVCKALEHRAELQRMVPA